MECGGSGVCNSARRGGESGMRNVRKTAFGLREKLYETEVWGVPEKRHQECGETRITFFDDNTCIIRLFVVSLQIKIKNMQKHA